MLQDINLGLDSSAEGLKWSSGGSGNWRMPTICYRNCTLTSLGTLVWSTMVIKAHLYWNRWRTHLTPGCGNSHQTKYLIWNHMSQLSNLAKGW